MLMEWLIVAPADGRTNLLAFLDPVLQAVSVRVI